MTFESCSKGESLNIRLFDTLRDARLIMAVLSGGFCNRPGFSSLVGLTSGEYFSAAIHPEFADPRNVLSNFSRN